MKKNILSLTLSLVVVGLMSLASCNKIDDYNSNIHDPEIPAAAKEPVKLNLPSGTQWAPLNVGARTPYDYGSYYTWNPDLVTTTWGSEWTLPTKAQVEELFENCTWEAATFNGNSLLVGTAKNVAEGETAAKIYLPCNGYMEPEATTVTKRGTGGYFWTLDENPENTENAYYMYANKGKSSIKISTVEAAKNYQYGIRCVKKQ